MNSAIQCIDEGLDKHTDGELSIHELVALMRSQVQKMRALDAKIGMESMMYWKSYAQSCDYYKTPMEFVEDRLDRLCTWIERNPRMGINSLFWDTLLKGIDALESESQAENSHE